MKIGIVPFSELFILLSVIFLIQFVVTVALNKDLEVRPGERLYSVRFGSPDGESSDFLRYASIGGQAVTWISNAGCKKGLFSSQAQQVLSPQTIKTKRDPNGCSVKPEAARTVLHPFELPGELDRFNDLAIRQSNVTLSASRSSSTGSGLRSQVTYQAGDVTSPELMEVGFCGLPESDGTHSQLEIRLVELSSGRELGAYLASYDLKSGKAVLTSMTDGSRRDLETVHANADCATGSVAESLGVVQFLLTRGGPALLVPE